MAPARPQRPLVVMAFVTSFLGWSASSSAEISGSPKGLVGGVLVGAELTVITEAIIGVEAEWMYLAGAGVGGVAGGVGGYFVDGTDSPGWSVAMLFGGMALAIPALVLTLDATRRHWPEPQERRLPTEPTPNPPDPSAGPELTLHLLPTGGKKLLRWDAANTASGAPPAGAFGWSVPDIYVTEAFGPAERDRYSLPMATLVQVPVFAATW